MPPGSEPTPPEAPPVGLPHTWRPLGVRLVGFVAGFGLVAVCVGAWIAIGPDLRARFTVLEKGTMLALGLLGATVWYALVRARLDASETGVSVVNGYRRRDLDWAQVVSVRLRRGAPWAEMDLSDGTSIPVMAIQGSDGDRARTALRQFGVELRRQTHVERNT
jgi:hypothetical protein